MAEKIRLVKGEKIRLTKVTQEGILRNVTAGMGWKPSHSSRTWDLDQSIVVLDEYGNYVKQISYMRPEDSKEFLYHGDDLVGGGGGGNEDDEQIDINFPKLAPEYGRIIVIMNIYQAYRKAQDLSMVEDAYIHLTDVETGKELVEYRIENSEKFREKTGLFVGEFYKKDGEWEFKAIGEPVRVRDIEEMVNIITQKTAEQSWEEYLGVSNNPDDGCESSCSGGCRVSCSITHTEGSNQRTSSSMSHTEEPNRETSSSVAQTEPRRKGIMGFIRSLFEL